MHLARSALIGLIVASLSACIAPATGGDLVIDSSSMPLLSVVQVCSLMSAAEAAALLGVPLEEAPSGTATGEDTECVYRAGAILVAGTYIRVEINRLGFSGQATLVNLHRGAHTLRVGSFQAIGADAQSDPLVEEAVLSVKLAKLPSDPALWIEAPTSAIARQAAVLILPRLAALH